MHFRSYAEEIQCIFQSLRVMNEVLTVCQRNVGHGISLLFNGDVQEMFGVPKEDEMCEAFYLTGVAFLPILKTAQHNQNKELAILEFVTGVLEEAKFFGISGILEQLEEMVKVLMTVVLLT